MSPHSYTISEIKRSLLNDLKEIFQNSEAYSITRIILEHYGYPEFSILKDPSITIDYKFRTEIKKIVSELKKNKPIQYILGETFFYDLRFFVDKSVLIPRPETEELVSHILLENKLHSPRILDIGCGSGCISVTLAHAIPGSKVMAMDIDEKALNIARKNAAENKVQLDFIHTSLFKPEGLPADSKYDYIVSNPPYVCEAERQFMLANVTKYEPELALFVPDDDPLVFYREIIKFSKSHLAEQGCIWVEINERFSLDLSKLFQKEGFMNVRVLKDIHDRDRFIKATKSNV